jgi:hypothetical protein
MMSRGTERSGKLVRPSVRRLQKFPPVTRGVARGLESPGSEKLSRGKEGKGPQKEVRELPLLGPHLRPYGRLANFGLSLVCLTFLGKARPNFGVGLPPDFSH